MLCSWLPGRADGDPCGGVDVRRIQSQWHNANGILIWFELPGTSESGAEMSQNRLPSPKAICTGDEADGIGLSGCGVGQHAIDRGKVVSRFAPGLAQEQRPHLFRVSAENDFASVALFLIGAMFITNRSSIYRSEGIARCSRLP